MKTAKIVSLILLAVAGLTACSNSSSGDSIPEKQGYVSTDTGKVIIVDVRTAEEWNQDGHAGCSVNYPLNELSANIPQLKGYDKVLVVCRSGSRANAAKNMLEQSGLKAVENKGAWQNISCP
jgi:rhodanese-related sulfurtransferase